MTSQQNQNTKVAEEGKKNRPDKLPALHFYPGDWWKDNGVQSLDHFHKGIWFELILIMFESSERGYLLLNGKQIPSRTLARRLALDEQTLLNALTLLLDCGVCKKRDDGVLYNARMVRDEETRQNKINAGKEGGLAKGKQKPSRIPSRTPSRTLAPPEDEIEDEDEDEIEDLDLKENGRIKILDFLEFDEISIETWKSKLGPEGFTRACEKLNGWIGQKRGSPEFAEMLINGKNASFALQNWVATQINNEAKSGIDPPKKLTNAEKILQMGRELEEEENAAKRNNKIISDNQHRIPKAL